MRLGTITNWAYGATALLSLASATTMILASNAQEHERAATAQRYTLGKASSQLGDDVYALSNLAREFVLSGDTTQLMVYQREAASLGTVEGRIRKAHDAGATSSELDALSAAMHWADALQDEQRAAVVARRSGDRAQALQTLFGAEYERELDRIEASVERFQSSLDQRTDAEVTVATTVAKIWKATSEAVLAVTAALFLGVLFFVFRRRVLQPVVRLSDVVSRLAAQDYAVEPPDYDQIDEIGDMAQALRVFRENGLERQRLERERDKDRSTRDLLSKMTQRMQGCDTLRDLKGVVERFVPEIAPALAGRLYLVDESRGALVEACSWLGPVHSRPEFSPLTCWALRRGAVHRPAGNTIDVFCDHVEVDRAAIIDTICLPLLAQREILGLMCLERQSDTSAQYVEIPEIYLRMLAENVALALANLHLRDTLRGLAMADPLTGLANRRQLDTSIETQLAEADRLRQPISCVMLDVDHFKRFNDEFGHDAGDAVLREVANTLKRSTREGALAFRYGGEEFLLLMPSLTPAQAQERAEDIRRNIEALRVVHDGRALGPVTASLGVATSPQLTASDRLVQTADAALLRAKKAGRNRVVVADARGTRESAA